MRTRPRDHGERRGNLLLVGTGTVATNLLMICVWLWWAFGTHNGFADMSVDALKDPYVRKAIAAQIVDALEEQSTTSRVALAAGPVLEPVVAEIVGTDAFKGLFYAGARQLHETVFTGVQTRMLVQVDDAAPMVKDSLAVVNPNLADTIPDGALNVAVGLSQDSRLDTLVKVASITGWLIWPLSAIALGSFGTAIVRSRDRRRTVLRIGVLLFVSGFFWLVVLIAGVAIVSRMVDGADDRAAVRALFRSVTHVLMLTTRVVLNAGIVLTLAALVAGEARVRARLRSAADFVRTEWALPKVHLLLGVVILVLGILVAVYPEVMVALVARSLGLALAFIGMVAVLDVAGAQGWVGAGDGRETRTVRRVAFVGTSLCLSVVLLMAFGGMALYQGLNATQTADPDPDARGCNGHVELCDRRLDQVVLAGTHNSMSASAEDGWFFARQTGGVGAQLAKGVRAFLLDAHYGTRVGGIVRTDFLSESDRESADAELTGGQRATLERMFAIIGGAKTPDEAPEVFFCHLYCELGATSAKHVFSLIDGYLAENPNEVVVLIIEDHASAADIEAAVRSSRLDRRALRHQPGQPLPTLRHMIESGRNVLIMAEREAGADGWYPSAYDELLQDTPYEFASLDEFSCRLGRGDQQNSLLLVNHWLKADPASIQVAGRANDRAVLLARVDSCQAERGRLPNVIAVDFYTAGDLFEVVDELNGVAVPAS